MNSWYDLFLAASLEVFEVAKNVGLGCTVDIKLARLDKSDTCKGSECFAINTDAPVGLELPSIQTGRDILQCDYQQCQQYVTFS